jgi:hypothetical protein
MIEHALALHWLADASDAAVDALLRAHQNRLQRMREPMSAGDWSVPIDVVDSLLDAQVPSSPEDRYLAFKHLCDRYEQPALYVGWLTETGFCHPSYSGAVAYTKGGDSLEGTGLLSQVDRRPADTEPTVAVLLLIASQGFQRLLIGASWADKLRDLETGSVSWCDTRAEDRASLEPTVAGCLPATTCHNDGVQNIRICRRASRLGRPPPGP